MNPRGIDFTGIALLAGLGVVLYVGYKVTKGAPSVAAAVSDSVAGAVNAVTGAVGSAVEAVTPTNPDNIFNRAFQPIADLFIKGGNPDEATGSQLLSGFGSSFGAGDQDDADLGAALRRLQRRPDLMQSPADLDDAELGRAMAAYSGAAFVDYSKLSRGVFK